MSLAVLYGSSRRRQVQGSVGCILFLIGIKHKHMLFFDNSDITFCRQLCKTHTKLNSYLLYIFIYSEITARKKTNNKNNNKQTLTKQTGINAS